MGDALPNGSVVRFSVFELDLRAGELRKHGVKIRLQEQPFQILQILLERPGELVAREELQKRLWPDTFVDADKGLYNAVKKLREALGDVSDTPRFIETLPRRGYRFISTLNGNRVPSPAPNGTIPNAINPSHWTRQRLMAVTVSASLVILGGLLVFRFGNRLERTSASNHSPLLKSKAQEDYLQGRYHADQAFEAVVFKSGSMKKSAEEFDQGMSYLERSIQEDPSYVPAYLELASNIVLGEPPHRDLIPKARAALIKALALDEANADTHLLMARYLYFQIDGGWDDAEIHYKRVIELRPDFAEGHEAYAEYLDDIGRFVAGMKEHQRAQMLDPDNDYLSSSPLTPRTVQLERTKKFMRSGIPNGNDYWKRGGLEFEMGQYSEALKYWATLARIYGWNEEAAAWERAYATGGSRALISEVARVTDEITKERYLPRDILIDTHRYAGDRDGTLAWLATAYEERNPVVHHLRSDPRWDPYRSDPRFQAIAREVGLP
jgi:DNA-binding winged helix-turn-helix (wHTH) protein/tetratricopeptide (TPR) repeat protein